MLLRSIKYRNFRPFKGEKKIVFCDTNEKSDTNITVILGDNTFGKSTIVLSFIWCLYGESKFTKSKDILNKKVEQRLSRNGEKAVASVEVAFEEDNKLYTMYRANYYSKNENNDLVEESSEVSLVFKNIIEGKECGQTFKIHPHDIVETINNILPYDLSSFFFFEGEKSNAIDRKDLGRAVKTLMDLDAVEKMRSHLFGGGTRNSAYDNSVIGDYESKISDESDNKTKEYHEKVLEAGKELQEIDEKIDRKSKEIQNYKDMISEIEDNLRKAGPLKEWQKSRDRIAVDRKRLNEYLEKRDSELIRLFNNESIPLFVTPLLKDATSKLEKMNSNKYVIKGLQKSTLLALLDRKECLCGCKLKKGSVQYQTVESYIDYVPPKDLGSLVEEMNETIKIVPEKCKDFIKSFEETFNEIAGIRYDLMNLEREEKALLNQLKEVEENNRGCLNPNLEEKLISNREKEEKLDKELLELNQERGIKISERDNAKKSFDKSLKENDKVNKFRIYKEYAQQIYCEIDELYKTQEQNLKDRLVKCVSALFNNMYSGKREITIDEKYNIKMTSDGGELDDTGGLRSIMYFAYVGGLAKLAYEVMKERECRDESDYRIDMGGQYPLVLDAAFSHTDENHTESIAKELSGSVNQLVLALMKKDWKFAKKGLGNKSYRLYELKKIDETEVSIEEK